MGHYLEVGGELKVSRIRNCKTELNPSRLGEEMELAGRQASEINSTPLVIFMSRLA